MGIGISSKIRQEKAKALIEKYGKFENQEKVFFFGFGFPELYLLSSTNVEILPKSIKSEYSPTEILADTGTHIVLEGGEVNLGQEILTLIGEQCGETKINFMKGLAYQIALQYNKQETVLQDTVLDKMLAPISKVIQEKAPPTKFRINASKFFSEVLEEPKSSYTVQNLLVRYVEGDLSKVLENIEERMGHLTSGIKDIDDILKYAEETRKRAELKKSNISDDNTVKGNEEEEEKKKIYEQEIKDERKEHKANIKESKNKMNHLLSLGANVIVGIAKQPLHKEVRELERYWGQYEPFEEFKMKFEHLANDGKMFQDKYIIDADVLVSSRQGKTGKNSRIPSIKHLEDFKEKLKKSLEIESYKRDYTKYLIKEKMLTQKEDYFKNLA